MFIDNPSIGQVSFQIPLHCGSKNQKAIDYYNTGNYFLAREKFDKANIMFLAAVKVDSNYCDAWDNLSLCYRKRGDFKSSFNSSLHSLCIDSTNATAWLNCGYAAFLDTNIYYALASFDHMQRIIPENPEGYYGKSLVLYSIDSISTAIINIDKAEDCYRNNVQAIGPEVFLLKGLIYFKSGNLQIAQRIFENVYSKFSDNAELNYFLGICIRDNENDPKRALTFFKKAKKLGYKIEMNSI
jgi:tetratricopeptide (TPR) repeat protein